MLKNMDLVQTQSKTLQVHSLFWSSVQVGLGSLLLALLSQISIPLYFSPVPLTLQTLGVFLLGLALGPRKGALAVLAYLTQATYGLPVLSGGHANPLWIFSPVGGYLVSFIFASFAVGYFTQNVQARTLWKTLFALVIGQIIIFFFGTLGLSFFVGFEKAIWVGIFPFLVGSVLKIIMAASLSTPLYRMKNWL